MIISVDGLDYSGKSTCAQILSELTGFEYIKIKKGSLLDYSRCHSEFEITARIIEEISVGIENKKNIVLDRGHLSALITGKIYDGNLDLDKLLQRIPINLIKPTLGLIITVPHKVAISRIRGTLTEQDARILASDYDTHQELLIDRGIENNYRIFNNNLPNINGRLRESLKDLLIKYSF